MYVMRRFYKMPTHIWRAPFHMLCRWDPYVGRSVIYVSVTRYHIFIKVHQATNA